MKLPRRTISASGGGRCRAAGVVAHRMGASLSDAAGAIDRRLSRRRRERHRRAPDGSMAVGAARPAIHRREPARRRHQYRHRGGRECAPGRLHASSVAGSQRDQRDALRKTQFQFHPRHRAGCGHHPRGRNVMVVQPSVPATTVPEFIAYAKANPGKINLASPGNGTRPISAGELFKMMTGVNMVHVPYRGGAPALTDLSAVRSRCPSSLWPRRSSTSGPASCVRWRLRPRRVGRTARYPDRGRVRAGL